MPIVKKIEVDSVKPVDYAAIAAFLVEQKAGDFTEDQWQEKFRDIWDHNPFFKEGIHARGWLLRDETNAVYGFLGNIPVPYARSGQEETAFALSSWFVHPDARRHSLALHGCFMDQEGVLLNTTPTPEVEEIVKGVFKFKSLTSEWIKWDYFLPIRTDAFSRYLQERFNLHPLLTGVSFVAAFFAKLMSSVMAFGKSQGASGIEVREVNVPPADIEPWWEAFKKTHPFTLARNATGLRYFLFSGKFVKACKVLEIRRDGKLLGFLSARLVSKKKYSYVEIIDVALLEDNASMNVVVTDKLKELARQWKSDIAFIKTNAFSARMQQALKQAGFWSVAGRARFYFFDPKLKLVEDEFYATPLDGDRVCF